MYVTGSASHPVVSTTSLPEITSALIWGRLAARGYVVFERARERRVVRVDRHGEVPQQRDVIAGASGFLLKRAQPEEVLAVIRAVAAGDWPLSSS